jgi:small subunit ribosomal protein S15
MLDKKLKQKIINKFKTHDNDTGSTPIQIAILTEEIKQLSNHLKEHKQDNSSRRGLLKKVNERRKLLKYFQRENEKLFIDLAIKLKLKLAKKMINDEEQKKAEEAELERQIKEKDELTKELKKLKEQKNKN